MLDARSTKFESDIAAKEVAQVGTKRVFLKSEAYVQVEHCKQKALRFASAVVQTFARSVVEVATIRAKQRQKNGELIAHLAKGVVMICDMMEHETAVREKFYTTADKAREDLFAVFEVKRAELHRIMRQRQLEKQLEEYERKKREDALREEREKN